MLAFVYADFDSKEEKERVLKVFKKLHEMEVIGEFKRNTETSFDVKLYLEVSAMMSSDKIEENILKLFDRTKVLEGYLDLYLHESSRQISLENE